jgi:hypothetical protein
MGYIKITCVKTGKTLVDTRGEVTTLLETEFKGFDETGKPAYGGPIVDVTESPNTATDTGLDDLEQFLKSETARKYGFNK